MNLVFTFHAFPFRMGIHALEGGRPVGQEMDSPVDGVLDIRNQIASDKVAMIQQIYTWLKK